MNQELLEQILLRQMDLLEKQTEQMSQLIEKIGVQTFTPLPSSYDPSVEINGQGTFISVDDVEEEQLVSAEPETYVHFFPEHLIDEVQLELEGMENGAADSDPSD